MSRIFHFLITPSSIECIEENFFDDRLGRCLRHFTCTENLLLELPMSITYLANGINNVGSNNYEESIVVMKGNSVANISSISSTVENVTTNDSLVNSTLSNPTNENEITKEAAEDNLLCKLVAEFNPMLSPPTELRIEGLEVYISLLPLMYLIYSLYSFSLLFRLYSSLSTFYVSSPCISHFHIGLLISTYTLNFASSVHSINILPLHLFPFTLFILSFSL
jgi:hypothetical protein